MSSTLALTFWARSRYPIRGLAVQFHRSTGGVDRRGLIACPTSVRTAPAGLRGDPPYTPGDAPTLHPRPPGDAARLVWRRRRGRSRPPGPDPLWRTDDARSGGAG